MILSLTLASVITNNMLELFFEDFEISLSFLRWTVLALAFFHFTMLKEKNQRKYLEDHVVESLIKSVVIDVDNGAFDLLVLFR